MPLSSTIQNRVASATMSSYAGNPIELPIFSGSTYEAPLYKMRPLKSIKLPNSGASMVTNVFERSVNKSSFSSVISPTSTNGSSSQSGSLAARSTHARQVGKHNQNSPDPKNFI